MGATRCALANRCALNNFPAMFRTKRRKIERLDFILAGAQKSGTTALHYFLSRHRDICMLLALECYPEKEL